jgi:hypothetical protein
MSPYQQNVTDFQKQEAVKDYSRQLPGMGAQASGAGAFGGLDMRWLQQRGKEICKTNLVASKQQEVKMLIRTRSSSSMLTKHGVSNRRWLINKQG